MTLLSKLKAAACLSLAVLALAPQGMAQTPRHEVGLSFGIITTDQMIDLMEDITTIVITLGTYAKQDYEFGGAAFLTYRYALKERLSLGFALGTYTTRGNLALLGETQGTFKESNYVGAAEITYRWVLSRGFQLYSGLGLGGIIKKGLYAVSGSPDETTSRFRPTFHVNLLGIRLGKALGFFGEIGAGYKGVINLGLSGRF